MPPNQVSVGAVVSAGPVDIRTQAQGGDRCAVEIGNKGVEVSNNKLTVTGDLCLKGSLKSRGAEVHIRRLRALDCAACCALDSVILCCS